MTKPLHCVLTTRDYAMMEDLLDSDARLGEGVAALARRKLAGAMIVFPDDVPPDVATVNSRIAFSVGDRAAETRVLVRDAGHRVTGAALRVDTLRGLALLGLEAGEHMVLERPDGSSETLRLDAVIHQPEAAARMLAERNVVSLDGRFRRKAAPAIAGGGDDDPGPHAA
jgi:regulator of nucleoside diphosphate kinase